MRHRQSVLTWLGGCLVLLLSAGPALAQTGTITGMVTQQGTGQPVAGAAVQLAGTNQQVLTRDDGRFLMVGVPAGSYTLRVEMLGHSPFEQAVTVAAGQTVTVDPVLQPEAISLGEIIVTGVAGATQKVRLPFAVDQITVEDMPVPAVSAASSIQGKVAGATVVAGSGRPGAAPSILLRGVTSIDAAGRSQEPLFIVDGAILGADMIDLDAQDIQNIEVIKGAAASSLYGSRAANGVIQITTKTGATLPNNSIRYTVRSRFGRSELSGPKVLVTHAHQYKMNESKTKFISGDGVECDWFECPAVGGVVLAGQGATSGGANAWNTFQSNPWPGGTHDQVEQFFDSGVFNENYVSASGRSGATNFHVSFSNLSDPGVMLGLEGLKRNNFRVNVDQSVLENLQLSAMAFYSRSTSDLFPESQGNPLFDLTRMPAGVDLTACEDDPSKSCLNDPQHMVLLPDPTNTESPNPLYDMLTREYRQKRGRFLGGAQVLFSPLDWLDFQADISYDRLETDERDLYPKGFRTVQQSSINDGYMDQRDELTEAMNASVTMAGRFDLSEDIHNVTKVRYLYERADNAWNYTSGYRFAVKDVPNFSNLDPTRLGASSHTESVRSDGYYLITDFDIFDKYTINALVRNDGSSLFGPEEQRHWYSRIAGAWRISQEPWFSVPGVDVLKLRYSRGTAGSRPRFEAQYETYTVDAGQVVPVTLGNKALKPEFTTENEVGLDAILFNGRAGLTLTYANTVTEDQILRVPLPAYTGYAEQWRNAGTLESNTFEASLDLQLLQTDELNWSTRLLFDKTKSEITEFNNVPDFVQGVNGQGLNAVFYVREGEEVGTFYGTKFATSCADLPEGIDCSAFAVNDEGYLVWVGDGGSLSDNAWGTSSGLIIGGRPVMWGAPVKGFCTDRVTGERTDFCKLGNTMPDYHIGLSSTLDWKGLSVYALFDAVQGFSVYNQPLQWAVFKNYGGIMDQTGVPEDRQKPLGYYGEIYGVSGLQPSSAFVEDASFVKLRELSFRYSIPSDLLSEVPGLNAFSEMALNLSGRNLHTWTDYRGYDPEVGKDGGDTGSAAIARVEGYQYPNFRTWTLGIELHF
ncbi:MAG TPA: SusC/RagA family TonB-linked outer membrane protein [Longimicrobiales bacterium]